MAKQSTKKTKPKPKAPPVRPDEQHEREVDQALMHAQVLAYYRMRADAFESDRRQFYAKLEAIRLK